MHIKHVIIQGFRSFKNQGEILEFSPKHNVIVGRNGSGKSNYFDAIQFVLLAPKFLDLRQDDRQRLLHEGVGSSVMSAFVEIVFDNSDGRFPVEGDEVVLRRTIGLKKDEFFLNRKRVQKQEVISLLESAGFSKSNPYFIVQQGKVSHLCVMKDEERLGLLKEVAGTRVYEDKRKESLKIMDDANSKRENIQDIVQQIEDKLNELQEEKDELTAYEQLDKTRRGLEYCLHNEELNNARDQLMGIEVEKENIGQQYQEAHDELIKYQDQLQTSEKELEAIVSSLRNLETKRAQLTEDIKRALESTAIAEASLHTAEERQETEKEDKDTLRAKLQELDRSMQELQDQIDALTPEHLQRQQALAEKSDELELCQRRMDALYAKQSRGKRFTTVEERNIYLQDAVDRLDEELTMKQTQFQAIEAEAKAEEQAMKKADRAISQQREQLVSKTDQLKEIVNLLKIKGDERNKIMESKQDTLRELDDLDGPLEEQAKQMNSTKQALKRALPRALSSGLAEVQRVADELKLKGYYGPVIDNIKITDKTFHAAVEAAAGNALFHVIVDNDDTATTLMQALETRKAGRLTFLPLNRLRHRPVDYPDTQDVCPLLQLIAYEPNVGVAIKHVFGKKLLARSLEIAERYSVECGLDAVTISGDVSTRRGAIDGGYSDDRISKIRAVLDVRRVASEHAELHQRKQELQNQAQHFEQQLTEVIREMQLCESKRNKLRMEVEQLDRSVKSSAAQADVHRENSAAQRTKMTALQTELTTLSSQRDDYAAEVATPLQANLTNAERQQLTNLQQQEKELNLQRQQCQHALDEVATQLEQLNAHMSQNLLKQRQDILVKLGAESTQLEELDDEVELNGLRSELMHARRHLDKLQSSLEGVDHDWAMFNETKLGHEKQVDELRGREAELQAMLDEFVKQQESLFNKRTMLTQTREQKIRLIHELGTLPSKEVEQAKQLDHRALLKQLKQTNHELKRFSHVNKKALDQYVSFSEQRNLLLQRKEELDKECDSINMLVQTLDREKDDAILRTFRGVSLHFTEVFGELVPGGHGQLIMKTRAEAAAAADDDEDEGAQESKDGSPTESKRSSSASNRHNRPEANVSDFVGVQVRVQFSGAGEQYLMQQLSGGQKALVALALIFAIQRCDPAPFYLFDELDQALDGNYRSTVAALIQRQAESEDSPTQFITTTFRPELVLAAHRWYGIYHQNKESNIRDLKRADAIHFVESLRAEEESATAASAPIQSRAEQALVTPPRPPRAQGRDQSHETSAKRSLALSPVGEDSEDELEVLPPEHTPTPEAPRARGAKGRGGKRRAH